MIGRNDKYQIDLYENNKGIIGKGINIDDDLFDIGVGFEMHIENEFIFNKNIASLINNKYFMDELINSLYINYLDEDGGCYVYTIDIDICRIMLDKINKARNKTILLKDLMGNL